MRRSLLTIVVTGTAVLLLGPPAALAQTPAEAAAAVLERGYYVDGGLDTSEARLAAAVGRASGAGVRFYVVILADNPPGGAAAFASGVLDRVGNGTVLVLASSQEAIESTEFPSARLEEALDRAFDAGGGDEGFVDSVVSTLTRPAPTSGDGGGSGWLFLLALVAFPVGIVWWLIRRQKRSAAESERRQVEEARLEIRSQLDAMANIILEISDQVSATETREDNEYLAAAGTTYTAASEAFAGATALRDLEDLADQIGEARWQLDAAAAIAHGRPVPSLPEKEIRHQCFFDPNHPEATEVAELSTPAGTRQVRVCKEDADRLRRGEEAKPRMIQVGGRQVPAPMAPRSYGGLGLGWLDVFTVGMGGASTSRSYDWAGSRSSSGTSSRLASTGSSVGRSGASRSRERSRSSGTSSSGSSSSTRSRSSGSSSRSSGGSSSGRSSASRSRDRRR